MDVLKQPQVFQFANGFKLSFMLKGMSFAIKTLYVEKNKAQHVFQLFHLVIFLQSRLIFINLESFCSWTKKSVVTLF